MAITVELPLNQVILGDCTEVMADWPDDSVDCIVTDPPYGISFMGKNGTRLCLLVRLSSR